MRKTIDLKEYKIIVKYEQETGDLDVEVYDELGDIIEAINIRSDEEDDEDEPSPTQFNLN